MKASQFVELLRKVIREEVRTVVKEELKPLKSLLAERQSVGAAPIKKPSQPTQKFINNVRTAPPKPAFSGPLSSILNETAASMFNTNDSETEEWPDMNNGILTADDAPMSMMSMFNDNDDLPSSGPMDMSGDPTRAFMKDYSTVLSKANELSQNYRG